MSDSTLVTSWYGFEHTGHRQVHVDYDTMDSNGHRDVPHNAKQNFKCSRLSRTVVTISN